MIFPVPRNGKGFAILTTSTHLKRYSPQGWEQLWKKLLCDKLKWGVRSDTAQNPRIWVWHPQLRVSTVHFYPGRSNAAVRTTKGRKHQQLISSCWALFWSHCSAVYSEAATLLVPLGNRASSEFPLAAKSGSTMEVEYDGNLISADYPQSVLHNTAKFEHQVDLSTQHARVKLRGLARSSWVQHVSCVQKVLFFWRR